MIMVLIFFFFSWILLDSWISPNYSGTKIFLNILIYVLFITSFYFLFFESKMKRFLRLFVLCLFICFLTIDMQNGIRRKIAFHFMKDKFNNYKKECIDELIKSNDKKAVKEFELNTFCTCFISNNYDTSFIYYSIKFNNGSSIGPWNLALYQYRSSDMVLENLNTTHSKVLNLDLERKWNMSYQKFKPFE